MGGRVRIEGFSVSRDGLGAGPRQSEREPLGEGGRSLHEWIFATRTGRAMVGLEGGSQGVDDEHFRRNAHTVGATIMGRNMFGPERGPWSRDPWRGWWGDEPPFGHPVFVLTHFARGPLTLGMTTFHFVTGGLDDVVAAARDVAADRDVLIGGGVAVVRAALAERLVDDVALALVPVALGEGERLFDDPGRWPDGYVEVERVAGEGATHVRLARAS
jgi:dihydrofolate reductase